MLVAPETVQVPQLGPCKKRSTAFGACVSRNFQRQAHRAGGGPPGPEAFFPRNRRGGVLVRLFTRSRPRNQSFWVSPPRSPLPAARIACRRKAKQKARIERSRRGEANEAPGRDQLLDLGKSMFPILRGAEIPHFSTGTLWGLGMSCFVGFWRGEPHEAPEGCRTDR